MQEPVETIEMGEGIRIQVHQDQDEVTNCNPFKDCDTAIQISIWHRCYNFGNNTDFATPGDFLEFCRKGDLKSARKGDKVFRLPVYLYDHSGLTVNTTGFSCPWDSGQVGWVWTTKKRMKERGWKATDENHVYEHLKEAVQLLDDYLTGNVYRFTIEDAAGEVLESCGGYYGDPHGRGVCILDFARESAEYHVEEAREKRLEYEARRTQCLAI